MSASASFLLVPKRIDRPAPAIFAHHQHALQFHLGKREVVGLAGDPDQAYAAELAQRGYVVIAPDALAFEERNWSNPSGEAEYYKLATRLVQRMTLLSKCLHDVSVALDYLASRTEVDPSRIGFIGHSYGGRMAIWAPSIDDRIRASVSKCGCVNYKRSFTPDTGVQMESAFRASFKWETSKTFSNWWRPAPCCCKRLRTTSGLEGRRQCLLTRNQPFPMETWCSHTGPAGHVFTPEMRENAYNFLNQHLKDPQLILRYSPPV